MNGHDQKGIDATAPTAEEALAMMYGREECTHSRDSVSGLAKLREKFPDNQISKLPKPTIPKAQWKSLPKAQCRECGGYHATTKTIHLSYVGHAALTDRLLDADLFWSWEPLAYDEHGLPRYDASGGLWIKLTVCGVTRLGYGNAEKKEYMEVGAREKEVIGDALRNAAMRFGAALELWHKGDLHAPENEDQPQERPPGSRWTAPSYQDFPEQMTTIWKITDKQAADLRALLKKANADQQKFLSFFLIDKITDLKAIDFERAVTMLESKINQPSAPRSAPLAKPAAANPQDNPNG